MSLDLGALLASQRAIKVAKADYDFTRDGGAYGFTPNQTEIVPQGSIIVGYFIHTTTGFTYAGGGDGLFKIGQHDIAAPSGTLGNVVAGFKSAVAGAVLEADLPITYVIYVGTVTAGAATIWVFYLPLVD